MVERHRSVVVGDQVGETATPFPQGVVVVAFQEPQEIVGSLVVDPDELFGFGDRQRPYEHSVDEAEHRRIETDAKGERHDDSQREAGGFGEVPPRVFQVASERVHQREPGRPNRI